MLREEEKDKVPGGNWRTYSRSVSWTERPPTRKPPSSKPQWNSKARACLPPLQPLSITRPSVEDWPKAGSDDVGIWPNPPTPGAKPGPTTPRGNSAPNQLPREFECMKDKLAFFDNECSRVSDYIFLGSEAIAKNREVLRLNRITHVLNCVGFVCPEYFNKELVYKTLWLQDCPNEDITSVLYDVFDYFEEVREKKGRVFVHCCKGVSRSTSLVIAYLMWKEGKNFDDAFELVKAARGVTNPNVGFACQLLQCQKRVHALPPSPSSVLRMYRMAPHSPYDPLHLVPKMLCEPGCDRLDSRGAFIVHVPSSLYIWIGKHCSQLMSDIAKAAASQIIRYEKVQCPVFTIKDGGESPDFWNIFSYREGILSGESQVKFEEKERKVSEYDLDFEIFDTALVGGVVPPLPLSEAGSETCLPSRVNGWNRLRRKFANGLAKEFTNSGNNLNIRSKFENFSQADISMDSFASYTSSTTGLTRNDKFSRSLTFNVADSYPSLRVSKLKSDSESPSISPLTSDHSSSRTVSPSSSNWSELSFVSAQSSPYESISGDTDSGKCDLLEESEGSIEECTHVRDNTTSHSSEEAISDRTLQETSLCSSYGECTEEAISDRTLQETSLCSSYGECTKSNLPMQMNLLSIDEESQIKSLHNGKTNQ